MKFDYGKIKFKMIYQTHHLKDNNAFMLSIWASLMIQCLGKVYMLLIFDVGRRDIEVSDALRACQAMFELLNLRYLNAFMKPDG